jgi:hypothetical protein
MAGILGEMMRAVPFREGSYGTTIGSASDMTRDYPFEPQRSQSGFGLDGSMTSIAHGKIHNGAFSFIQATYNLAPWTDNTNELIMSGMMAFAVRAIDQSSATPGDTISTHTLPKFAQVLSEAEDELYYSATAPKSSPMYNPDADLFVGYRRKFGEDALFDYHRWVQDGKRDAQTHDPMGDVKRDYSKLIDMDRYYQLSTQDLFCYCTPFGVSRRINYLGVVITVGNTAQIADRSQYFANVGQPAINIGIARRLEVTNVFGESSTVEAGSHLWIILKRAPSNDPSRPAPLTPYPMASYREIYASNAMCSYMDPSGRIVRSTPYTVGLVLDPPSQRGNAIGMQIASNTGIDKNVDLAALEHMNQGSMFVALEGKM